MTVARDLRVPGAAILVIAVYAGLFPLASTATARIGLAAPLVIIPLLWWMFSGATRWIAVLLAGATLLPPLPIPLGDSGPHPAILAAAAGLLIGLARLTEWRFSFDPVTAALLWLFSALLISAAFALFYSGPILAAATLARIALFGIGLYTYLYAAHGPRDLRPSPLTGPIRLLFVMAMLAAAFACFDFYYQLPAPAGYSQQFIWLSSGVVRRAQGLYYEASTMGNFSAFFLVLAAVAWTQRGTFRPLPRTLLLAGTILLSAALMFSYSRASILNVIAALIALAFIKRIRIQRLALALVLSIGAAVLIVQAVAPTFAASYWFRLSASVEYFWSSPEGVLSGRVASWQTLISFLLAHPWHMLFGVGYKTLAYSDFIGKPVIADNTYLSLLLETGFAGLLAFVFFSWTVIRAGVRAARSGIAEAAFLGTWIACFWTGQMVQMFSGDLLTYWRVLPIYFWVIAEVVRRNRGEAAA